ncbi:MAG: hypothetical protein KGS28_17340 [Betaproteobacteria bacterium]|nr:hypothetical protein [Betaproteobacteria bacterium]
MSHSQSDKLRRVLLAAAAACCAAGLAACGGGAAVVALVGGGVGTGGTGIAFGTVIGLGSVIVDGKSYSSATPTYYAPTSTSESAQTTSESVELGARMDLTLGAGNQPATALVQPELQGVAGQVDPTAGTLTVNGMRVRVNTDPALGPQTLYSGLTGLSGITSGSTNVEVHGAYGVDAQGPYLWATLIEQVPGDSSVTRLVGTATAVGANSVTLDTSATPIPLNANTQLLLPAGVSLAVGDLVYAWNRGSNWVLRVAGTGSFKGPVQISGVVYDVGAGSFMVAGIPVESNVAVGSGQYVVVSGQADGQGRLAAQSVDTYSASNPSLFELHGTITGFVSPSSFLVRGTPVDASQMASALTAQLGNGVYVDITGQISSGTGNVIVARTLSVQGQPGTGDTVDLQGSITGVAGNQITVLWQMQNTTTPVTVTLASNCAFNHGDASNLTVGTTVQVEGTWTGTNSVDAYTVNFGAEGEASALQASGRVYSWSQGTSITPTPTVAASTSTFMLGGNQLTIPVGTTIPAGFGDGADVELSFTSSGGINTVQKLSVDN